MKKLVIIGAGEFQVPLIKKAKELGYETHVFAWEDGAVGKDFANYFYPISVLDDQAILSVCRQINPQGVVSAASEVCYIAATKVASQLNLPCNDPKYLLIQTNKYHMRNAFRKSGLETPFFFMTKDINLNQEKIKFPVIVKPTDRSGSRAICKITESEMLQGAITDALAESFSKEAIIEEFIEGDEYSCESISICGKHHILAITKKFTTNEPNFIETAHIQPSDLNESMYNKVCDAVQSALDVLHVRNSASHAEFRIDRFGNIRFIEIGARMGGDCIGSHLVPLSSGFDYLRMIIDVAVGNDIVFKKLPHYQYAAVKFLLSNEDKEECEKIEAKYPGTVVEKFRNTSDFCQQVCDSGSRMGYTVFASNDKLIIEEVNGLVAE